MGWSWSGQLQENDPGSYQAMLVCGQGVEDGVGNRDDDGTWHLPCNNGYSLTLTNNGAHAIVINGGRTDEWDTSAKADEFDCYGACEDRKGVCLQCTQYEFTSEHLCVL